MNYDDNHETILRLRAQVAALTAERDRYKATLERVAGAKMVDSVGPMIMAARTALETAKVSACPTCAGLPAVTREELIAALRQAYGRAEADCPLARSVLARIDAEGGPRG